jgi:hypothetical protein
MNEYLPLQIFALSGSGSLSVSGSALQRLIKSHFSVFFKKLDPDTDSDFDVRSFSLLCAAANA